jgi:prepilin-type N-terminal cleavage/methylation domain-containing protein
MNNQIMENENKGFSLVELIVVIAIMAVLTSVLAPSLLGYVEKSRMQKDDSAMGEVANAIKLALADQNVYDECLTYNEKGNYSCYVDGTYTVDVDPTSDTYNAIIDKAVNGTQSQGEANDYFHFLDNTRLKDETTYTPAGNMRGMTITFVTDGGANTAMFQLKDARINEIVEGKDHTGTDLAADGMTLENMTTAGGQAGQLYNKLRAVIGDNVVLSSQTYRNSEYTVFIRMGSMGGNQASAQDAVAVYGQWNGTNL